MSFLGPIASPTIQQIRPKQGAWKYGKLIAVLEGPKVVTFWVTL